MKIGEIYHIDKSEMNIAKQYNDLFKYDVMLISFDANFFYYLFHTTIDELEIKTIKTRQQNFLRDSIQVIKKNSKLIGEVKLNEDLVKLLAPHLTSVLCRIKSIDWDSNIFKKYEEFEKWIENFQNKEMLREKLKCGKIYLSSKDINGINRKKVILEAENGSEFTVKELLWKASQFRNGYVYRNDNPLFSLNIGKGIGIYRLGIYKSLPHYYLDDAQLE